MAVSPHLPASMDMKVSGSWSSRWVPPVLTVMSVLGSVICMFTDDRPETEENKWNIIFT